MRQVCVFPLIVQFVLSCASELILDQHCSGSADNRLMVPFMNAGFKDKVLKRFRKCCSLSLKGLGGLAVIRCNSAFIQLLRTTQIQFLGSLSIC